MPPSDILLFFGPITIYWYGFCIAAGLAACYGIYSYLARKIVHIPDSSADAIFFAGALGGVIGARALYVLYHLSYFAHFPLEIPAVWHGGWVWHGALIGGSVGVALVCRLLRAPLLSIVDALAPGLALGQALGRIGNFFNQEAYGPPTDLPWGIPIDPAHRIAGFENATHFHPAFAYESFFDLGIFFFLFWLMKHMEASKRKSIYTQGSIFFLYILVYSAGRFCLEFLRIDTVPFFWGLRAPQWISMLLFFAAGHHLLQSRKKLI